MCWPPIIGCQALPLPPRKAARLCPGPQNQLPDPALVPRIACQTMPCHPKIRCHTLTWDPKIVCQTMPWSPPSVARPCPGPQDRLPDLGLSPQNRLPELTLAFRIGCQTLPWPRESLFRPRLGTQTRLPDLALTGTIDCQTLRWPLESASHHQGRGSVVLTAGDHQSTHQEEKAMALAIKIRRPNVTVASEELCLRSNVGSLPPRAREGNGSTDQTSLVYNHQDKSNGSGESSSPGREGSRAWTRVLRCVVLVSMGGR